MWKLPDDSGEYLSALHSIRILELRGIGTGPVSQEDSCNCFSTFSEILADLTLKNFFASFSTKFG